jgi:regulator of protease activity HflC (stomatin/prohibitin superfamily)
MGCCISIGQASVGIQQTCGRHVGLLRPGLHFMACCIGTRCVSRVSLRVRQVDLTVETKTLDNVFVHIGVSVQYHVVPEKVYDAYYSLTNAEAQISAFIFDSLRSSVPKIGLDAVFLAKEELAGEVKEQLDEIMGGFGYFIVSTLITDIDPDPAVRQAMNEIESNRREKEAAMDKAEAAKIAVVKAAEADAESKRLAGVGIARQRTAIIDGLRQSLVSFSDGVSGVQSSDALELILITQYLDAVSDVAKTSKCRTVFTQNASAMADEICTGTMSSAATGL